MEKTPNEKISTTDFDTLINIDMLNVCMKEFVVKKVIFNKMTALRT